MANCESRPAALLCGWFSDAVSIVIVSVEKEPFSHYPGRALFRVAFLLSFLRESFPAVSGART